MADLLWPILVTFATSLIPGLELRAGIPAGLALGLPTTTAVAVAVAGNVLQIPLVLLVLNWAYRHGARFPLVDRWLRKTEAQVERHRPLIRRLGWIGVTIFVLLPLPATGVWGGGVLARLLQLTGGGLWFGLSLGIALSGLLMGAAAQGAISVWRLI
ncbi:MAG: COG2426 family protein [Bacillota bacterium]